MLKTIGTQTLKTMRTLRFFILATTLFAFYACNTDNEITPSNQEETILPEQFSVNLPTAISSDAIAANNGRTSVDTLEGNDIYRHLRAFIRVGEHSAEVVEDIIIGIRKHRIDRAMVLTINSDDDNRDKHIVVEENVLYEGTNWDYFLTVTDADSDEIAFQLFWNRSPRKGIAIMNPYQMDRRENDSFENLMYRIEYSEGGEHGYDAHMIVSISGIPLPNALDDMYALRTLKMFVGKTGEEVDVYGNSNHPNARLFNEDQGFNWAFIASGNDREDIGVAEVALPPSFLDEPSGDVILEEYAIKKVFEEQIYEYWPNIEPETVDAFLYNTAAPGFFNEKGFVTGGESPGAEYSPLLENLEDLSPYNPKEVTELLVEFANL